MEKQTTKVIEYIIDGNKNNGYTIQLASDYKNKAHFNSIEALLNYVQYLKETTEIWDEHNGTITTFKLNLLGMMILTMAHK